MRSPRLRVVLVHGMGGDPGWWDPVLPALRALETEPVPARLPPLREGGPEGWVEAVRGLAGGGPCLLAGHSLGAAVCLAAARGPEAPGVEGVLLLALPSPGARPPAVPGLSLTDLARVGLFLSRAPRLSGEGSLEVLHLLGERDEFIPREEAARLPFPLTLLPSASHDLARWAGFPAALQAAVASTGCARSRLDPARRAMALGLSGAAGLGLGETAPPPARLDVEVTTRCQLTCPRCARTFLPGVTRDGEMGEGLLARVLEGFPEARELFLVGLGEPLLHPRLPRLVALAAHEGLTVRLVTNGLLADPGTLRALAGEGLSEVTFSLDTATDPPLFARLRGGADLAAVLANLTAVPAGLRRSLFVTLSRENAGALPGIVDLARREGLPAVAVSDLNFPQVQGESLAADTGGEVERLVGEGVRHARRSGVFLVGPHFHDTVPEPAGYLTRSLREPEELTSRSGTHLHCLAPWRAAVVGFDGTMTPCNCAPSRPLDPAGSLAAAWNGPGMKGWRRSLLGSPGEECLSCPRL